METKNTLSYSLAEETFESENAFGTEPLCFYLFQITFITQLHFFTS